MSNKQIASILTDIHSGYLDSLKDYHKCNPEVLWTDIRHEKVGDTILHISARLGYVEIVIYLLEQFKKCCVDCKTSDNKTALHEAAQFAQPECAAILIQHGAEVNALKKADWTPLMLACTKLQNDSKNMIELLVKNGALVNYKNKDGWSPAHLLTREGNLDLLNLLTNNYGLNIKARTNNGRTVLHVASLHGHLHMVAFFLELGLPELSNNSTDQCGNTAMHEAVLGGNCDVVKFLSTKTDVFAVNTAGYNCLHLAVGAGHCDVARYLLEILRFDVNCGTSEGNVTALHIAARKNFKDIYDMLLNFGASQHIQDCNGRKPAAYFNMKS